MNKTALLLALAISGCATQTFKAATQNYRIKGEDNATVINGAIFHQKQAFGHDSGAGIYLDGILHIKVPLDQAFSGEATGMDYKGKSTAASCSGNRTSQATVEVRCMVFIDNERTVTLTF